MATTIDQIDERYLDYDLQADSNFVFGDRGLGLCGGDWGVLEQRADYVEMTDREIDEAIEQHAAAKTGGSYLVTRIFSQGREGSCVANATAQSMEIVQGLMYGLTMVVHLSAISLYKRIGSSAGSGAFVSDGLKEASGRGVLPLDNSENRDRFDHTMNNTGWSTPMPRGWESTAALFVILEVDIIKTLQGLKTALAKLLPVVVGRDGHSICYSDIVRRSGQYVAPYPNSWDYSWGSPYANMDGGFGFDSLRMMQESARWAFAVRTVRSYLHAA